MSILQTLVAIFPKAHGKRVLARNKISRNLQKRSSKFFGRFQNIQARVLANGALNLSREIFPCGAPFVSSSSLCVLLRRMTTYYQLLITEVNSQIYLGSSDNAKDDKKHKNLGITHIISLIGPKHLVEGIKHKHKPMCDYGRTNLKQVIQLLRPFMIESQKVRNKLFVHCQSRQNRSATLVIAMLIKLKYGPEKLMDAYSMVKQKRLIVQIIEKYANQLSNIESEIFGAMTMPNDWMRIESHSLDTGKLVFQGERSELSLESLSLQSVTSLSQTSHSRIHNLGTK